MKFYKYREVNKHNLKSLEKGQLWCCKPYLFNDPFDSQPLISKASYKRFVSDHGLDKNEKDNDLFLKILIYLIKYTQDLVYVCSLTKISDNPAMWSHYCKQYTGYVVEYDFCLNDDKVIFQNCSTEISATMEKVLYNNKYENYGDCLLKMAFELFSESKTKSETQKELALTVISLISKKSRDWIYEKEYRIVVFRKGNDVCNLKPAIFIPAKPKKVVVGYKMKFEDYLKIKKICEDKHIDMYFAYPAPFVDKYRVYTKKMDANAEAILKSGKHFF